MCSHSIRKGIGEKSEAGGAQKCSTPVKPFGVGVTVGRLFFELEEAQNNKKRSESCLDIEDRTPGGTTLRK